jgi:hypothetical protein
MQTEVLLHGPQQRVIWLVQSNPDEATVRRIKFAHLFEISVRDPASALVGSAVDYHALIYVSPRPWRNR